MSQLPTKPNFRWETGYEKTWDAIREDESGSLVTRLEQLVREAHSHLRQKRRHLARADEAGHVRLGMMRHLFLIIDMSAAMLERDLKPSRILCTLRSAAKFVEDFFDQNPTSQLGIIITNDTRAERITELSGSPARHLASLEDLAKRQCSGESSLQNALTLAESRLKHMPEHSSREIIILVGSLTTCDPGDIHQTIQSLITQHIHCSVISLAVEVFIHKALAESTQGSMHVILDALHLKTVLQDFVPPPVAKEDTEATLIRIGFPHSNVPDAPTSSALIVISSFTILCIPVQLVCPDASCLRTRAPSPYLVPCISSEMAYSNWQ
nr:unnamed protein product [Spirometra erinaceieuropaei]